MSATMYGQKINEKRCRICGRPIIYGMNGAQMFDTCFECYRPEYRCKPTPIKNKVSCDELDALEDKCLGDDLD
jgi:hypothetical protein